MPFFSGSSEDHKDSSGPSSSVALAKVDFTDRYAPFIVRGTILSLGVAGAFMFARSIRMFTQFQHARQIPDEFIRKQFRLRGTVASVLDDGCLRVTHQPIFSLPKVLSSRSRGGSSNAESGKLTLRLAGIEVSEDGSQWLRQNLGSSSMQDGKKVWFTLIKRGSDSNSMDCEVGAKISRLPVNYSLNQELIRRGLARVPGGEAPDHFKSLQTIPAYSRLVNQLLISEQIADRRGVGMWRDQRNTWVESIRAFPSQAKEIIRYSAPVRLASVLGIIHKLRHL